LATSVFLVLGVGSASGEVCSGGVTVESTGPHTVKTVSVGRSCASSGGVNYLALALLVFSVVLPILTAIYLGRRATRAEIAA
jgi:hypothetical protein